MFSETRDHEVDERVTAFLLVTRLLFEAMGSRMLLVVIRFRTVAMANKRGVVWACEPSRSLV